MGEVEFPWVGGRPSLDLCNTSVEGCDLLDDGSALAAWLSKAGCARTCGLPEPDDLGRIRRLRVRRVQKAPTGDWFVVLTNPELPRGRDRFVPLSEYLTRYVPAA